MTSMLRFSAAEADCSAASRAELVACSLASKLLAILTIAMISSSVRARLASSSLAIWQHKISLGKPTLVGSTVKRRGTHANQEAGDRDDIEQEMGGGIRHV